MPILIRSAAAMIVLSAAACAPIVWDKPGATQAEFRADNYTCEAQARALSPGGSYAQGRIGFVVATTLVSALATAADQSALYRDCMSADGYMPHQAYAAAQLPVPAGPPPLAPAPAGAPRQATALPASPAPAPLGPGRVVLFPVTIYSPYYPPSVFVDLQ